jgi:SRSO17 transposase
MAVRVQPSHGYVHGAPPHKEVWLLVEWPEDEKEPTKYFLCDLPKTYTLRRLVRLAKARWKIEQDYQQLKEELGLDHYEGRNWEGWHHHVTLVMLAQAFLTLETLRNKKTSGWTLPRTRREIQYMLFTWTGVCAFCGCAIGRGSRSP